MNHRGWWRQVVSIGALAGAAFATAATSQGLTTVVGRAGSGELRLDGAASLAVQRFVVTLNEFAGPGLNIASSGITIERTDRSAGVRMTVAAARPGGTPGASAATSAAGQGSPSEARAADVAPGSSVGLPLDCTDAPCEVAFRVIAERASGTDAATVSWTARATLVYGTGNWPSGADASVRVEPAVALDVGSRSLTGSIPAHAVTLSPGRPAFGAVVELRLAAAAVPSSGDDVVTTAVFDSTGEFSIEGEAGAPSAAVPAQWDPFAGCAAGVDCVRRYVVWGDTERYPPTETVAATWTLDVNQLRLVGGVPPAGSLSARIVREYSTTPAPAQRLHAEGDIVLPAGQQYATGAAEVTYRVSRPGSSFVLADRLPIPATAEVNFALPAGTELESGETVGAGLLATYRETSYIGGRYSYPVAPGTPARIQAFTFGQRPGDAHSETASIRIEASANVPKGIIARPITLHWTVDIVVYGYEGVVGPTLLQASP